MKQTSLILSALAMTIIFGCASTARLSDFQKSPKEIDFNKIANSRKTDEDKSWNSKTGFEYYILTGTSGDSIIVQAINNAFKKNGYTIKYSDTDNGAILAERGLQANEWKSVAGVYYQKNGDGFEMYVRCKITQDITGGWREDRAKQIGESICNFIHNCNQSYAVKTSQ